MIFREEVVLLLLFATLGFFLKNQEQIIARIFLCTFIFAANAQARRRMLLLLEFKSRADAGTLAGPSKRASGKVEERKMKAVAAHVEREKKHFERLPRFGELRDGRF